MDAETLFKVRQKFIDEKQNLLMKDAADWQLKLLDQVMEKFVKQLTLSGGVITNNSDNIKLTAAIDEIFNAFEQKASKSVVDDIVKNVEDMFALNIKYYSLYSTDKKQFTGITRAVNKSIRDRLGYDNKGNITKDSYLDNFINDKTMRLDVRKLAYKYVTGGRKMSDLLKTVRTKIIGSNEAPGLFESYVKTFGYDLYAQYDRTINKEFATRLDLKYFVYAGGLVEGSRLFCKKKNNKVFTTDEAELWVNDKTLPRTKAEKDNGAITDYIPVEDMGRWNCRHIARFISEQQAIRLRPDLKTD